MTRRELVLKKLHGLPDKEVEEAIKNLTKHVKARLRFGSYGDLVVNVQEILKELHFYEGMVDGDFGPRTTRAVLDFQTNHFGLGSADGIVGPQTASALGIEWPTI